MKPPILNEITIFDHSIGNLVEVPFYCNCAGASIRGGLLVERINVGQDQDVVIIPIYCPFCEHNFGTLTIIANLLKF